MANCQVRCWQGCGSADTGGTVHRLPSGRAVKVLGVTKMFFSKGDPAPMLKYRTDLRLDEQEQLRKEVERSGRPVASTSNRPG